MRRFAWLFGSITAAGATFVALASSQSACSTHQCDLALVDEAAEDGGAYAVGAMIDDDTWQSNPITGKWLHLGPQTTLILHVPKLNDRVLVSTEAYVSVDPAPYDDNSNWTTAAGNIVEFQAFAPSFVLDPDSSDPLLRTPQMIIQAHNDTCGDYFLRVVLRAAPVDGGASDAASDGDAGTSDGDAAMTGGDAGDAGDANQ